MASWSGFTDEEVLRLKQQTSVTTEVSDHRGNNQESSFKQSSITNTSKKRKPREKIRTRQPGSDKPCEIKSSNSSSSRNVPNQNVAESFSADTSSERVSTSSQDISLNTEEDVPESERVISFKNNTEIFTETEREVPKYIDEGQGIPWETNIKTHKDPEVRVIEEPER